ncbi:MAG: CorA family divalent cation transporter [Cellulosilyticum sp.]|nr:hypothetical protein [Cellulosilyticum sp.]MEE1072113.1 CorA family divalent cation transporter [Cellulosilyticum sp.]
MQGFDITKEQKIIPIHDKMKQMDHAAWLIFTKEEIENLKQSGEIYKRLQLNEFMLKRWLDSEKIAKVEIYAQYDFGILQKIIWNGKNYKTEFIYFLIDKNQLVIVVDELGDWLKEFIQTLQKDKVDGYTLGYVFYRILDDIIAEDRGHLEEIQSCIEHLENDVLNDVVQHFLKEMSELKKQIAIFKGHYDPLIDIIEDLIGNDNEICTREDVRYFKILKNRVSRLNHLIDQINEYTTHVREAYDAQVDIQLNRIMKYFTLMTSLFLPLTLIVGWYGMNFTSMPEISWKYGYFYVIILSLLSSVVCIWWFKKKKWL